MSAGRRRKRRRTSPPAAAGSTGDAAPGPNEQVDTGKTDAAAKPKAAKPKAAKPNVAKPKTVEDPLLGRTLGRCKIEAQIGSGRTSIVYRANYEALDQTVALKVLQPDMAANPELVERFAIEARAIAQIDNENVLKIYDVGEEDGHHYMVVELLEGEEILDLIKREGQVDQTDALRIVRQAANGMAAAHDKGIIHRDIKPQNLFLLEDGTVKVVDFGLAARYDDSSERVGTPHYMAPEVCESGDADLGSDVYALGIVLYHLLVGQPPYAGKSIQEILRAHIAAKPLRPEREQPTVSREVADIVRTLTKADPLARPAAADIVPLLDKVGGKELKEKTSLRGRRRGSRSRAAVIRRERQGKQNMTPVFVAMGAAAVIAVIVAVSSGSDNPSPTDTTETGSPSDGSPERVGARFTGEDAETPAQRLRRERAEATAKKEQDAAAHEREAREALARAETQARDLWKTDADTDAVIATYRSVQRRYKKTVAGNAARDRIKEIKDGKRHPHPDRRFAAEDAVAQAQAKLDEVLPGVLKDIEMHAYNAARTRLPAKINDATGTLAAEIDFWYQHLRRLSGFKQALTKSIKRVAKLGTPATLPIKGKPGTVTAADERSFTVKLGSQTKSISWHDVANKDIAKLAFRTMGNKDAKLLLLQLSFAYAHNLDSLWDRENDLGSATNDKRVRAIVTDYIRRFEANEKKK